jgi:hypothetical protein
MSSNSFVRLLLRGETSFASLAPFLVFRPVLFVQGPYLHCDIYHSYYVQKNINLI